MSLLLNFIKSKLTSRYDRSKLCSVEEHWIPRDVLLLIFQYLELKDLVNVQTVSKKW